MAFLVHLHKLMDRQALTAAEASEAMSAILAGEVSTAQIAAFLVALRMNGETAEELAGMARAMRSSSVRLELDLGGAPLLDVVGTGGDGASTLNVSTLAALVAAGAGVKVAKHGNRSVSSLCGSADVLEALGVRLDIPPAAAARAIREIGFAFLFAPLYHPAMKHAAAARAELKTRTAFNLLGPLTNPAGATYQLIGAPSPRAAELIALALASLGTERACVVHGAGGLDEVGISGESLLLEVVRGAIASRKITPEDFGVRPAKAEAVRGGEAAENRAIAEQVLGGAAGAARDIVLVNAAVALRAAGRAADFKEGMRLAAAAIDSGAAARVLREYAAFSQAHGA